MENDIMKKADPLCPVFGTCGGCTYQDLLYPQELAVKESGLRSILEESLGPVGKIIEPIMDSPNDYHYRHRIDLKLNRKKDRTVSIGFSPNGNGPTIEIDHCYIAREEIADALPRIKKEAVEKLTAKHRQANLVVKTGDAKDVRWGGIGRRSLELADQDHFWTVVNGRRIYYSLNTFFQANLSILPKVIDRLRSLDVWTQEMTFLDLYGGVGLFSVGVYDLVKDVVVLEESVPSISIARKNFDENFIKNFTLIPGRVEDNLDMAFGNLSGTGHLALIDPPRAGLSDRVRHLLSDGRKLKNIIYVSCHPESLVRDLKEFVASGWQIETVVPMDFFPRTRHLEVLVLLTNRKGHS